MENRVFYVLKCQEKKTVTNIYIRSLKIAALGRKK